MKYQEKCRSILEAAITAGPASPQSIASAEKRLNLVFPKSYRNFLEQYGSVVGKGFGIAGLFEAKSDQESPFWDHIVLATERRRHASKGRFAPSLLAIGGDGVSLMFHIDSNGDEKCPVIAIGPGIDEKRIADSFEEFVVRLSRDDFDL